MSDIQLYSYPTSPYGQKVGCYLKYKQLDYRFVGVSPLRSEQIKFTGQRQVPVLQIGDEWRKESSELGMWLDQLFPERPIMPSDEVRAQKVRDVDDWISQSLITAMFRGAVEWQSNFNSMSKRMVEQLDLSESMSDMMLRLEQEFVDHLDGQDYLGGESELNLADLSAFPIIANAYMTGMRSNYFLIDRPEIRAWAQRVARQLPDNPLLVPDSFIKRSII